MAILPVPVAVCRGTVSYHTHRSWPLGRLSDCVPALPESPPRPPHCNSAGRDWANSFSLVVARRRVSSGIIGVVTHALASQAARVHGLSCMTWQFRLTYEQQA